MFCAHLCRLLLRLLPILIFIVGTRKCKNCKNVSNSALKFVINFNWQHCVSYFKLAVAFTHRIYVAITTSAAAVLGTSRGQPLSCDVTIRYLFSSDHHHNHTSCSSNSRHCCHHICGGAVHFLTASGASTSHRTSSSAATGTSSY